MQELPKDLNFVNLLTNANNKNNCTIGISIKALIVLFLCCRAPHRARAPLSVGCSAGKAKGKI